jgi:regulator of sirC expression with transglutaminase-like and TPR domain
MDAFAREVGKDDFHLARACLLLAQDVRPEVDVDAHLALFEPWTTEVARRAAADGLPAALRSVLALGAGFRGNVDDYYDPDNSYLDAVLRRRLGIPITLSVVYLEVARRLGKPLVAVGMPGHFLVRHEETLIDPFHGGRVVTEADCARLLDVIYQGRLPFSPDMLRPTPDRDVLARVLTNLKAVHARAGRTEDAIRAIDRLLQLNPLAMEEHRDRGLLKLSLGEASGRADVEAYLDVLPNAPDATALRTLLDGP